MSDKIGPEQCPQAIDAVQGCGNPSCSICMPAGGRDPNASFLFGAPSSYFRDAIEAYGINYSDQVRARVWEAARGLMDRPMGVTPNDAARDRLVQAEKMARGPVKQFILDAEHKISWTDVIGNEEAHRAMIEAIEFPIKHKKLFEHYNKKPTKGILLKGPPGCGKTMLGKAAAGVIAQLSGGKTSAILSIKATELQEPYVGQTETLIRQIFAYARAYKALHGHQLVVFIDEADAILPARNGGPGNRGVAGWEESNVATFLAEMDGMEESGALVILATNRPTAIDQALLRDGRIDRQITVRRPTPANARIIFERAFAKAPVADHVVADPRYHMTISLEPYRDYLVDYAMDMLFDPMRRIIRIKHDKGTDWMTMTDIVSGAMMVGLVERIKANAFHRDIKSGEITGIMEEDIYAAIERVTEDQKESPDIYAMTEFAQRLKASVIEVEIVRTPEIKYSGTLQ